jgi:hypothetical protein
MGDGIPLYLGAGVRNGGPALRSRWNMESESLARLGHPDRSVVVESIECSTVISTRATQSTPSRGLPQVLSVGGLIEDSLDVTLLETETFVPSEPVCYACKSRGRPAPRNK